MSVSFAPVEIGDRQWVEWAKEWPEDLRDAAKEKVALYRRVGLGESDRERAFNAFLAYRALAPAHLGGPHREQPAPAEPQPEPDPDWSDL